jgi:hypothetical protein
MPIRWRNGCPRLERLSQPPQQDSERGELEEAEIILGLRLIAGKGRKDSEILAADSECFLDFL